ncbi:MAG: Uncharacterised protein [Methanobacteriota archaeon]|nr:MAG: Uncharacterised protein [Euryarchaeota archaeon]
MPAGFIACQRFPVVDQELGSCKDAELKLSIFETAESGDKESEFSNLPISELEKVPKVKLPGISSPVQVVPVPSATAPVSSTCSQASITVAFPGTSNASLTVLVWPER